MYIRFGAQFPDPGIGLVVGFPRALTDRLERFEIGRSRDAQQPLVEERLHIGKHDLAIGVVLHLLVRLVADAHRPHPAIAVERLRLIFDQPSFARSEEHTSELQSLMRTSYAVFCLKTKKTHQIKK